MQSVNGERRSKAGSAIISMLWLVYLKAARAWILAGTDS